MFDPELAQIVRSAQRVGATLKFGTITADNKVKVDAEGILDDTPPGLIPQPYEVGRSVAILRMGPTTLVAGYLGGVPAGQQLQAGVDYQTPLAAGVDYQTPLKAGTDYQAPLSVTKPNLSWSSQNGFSLIGYNAMTSMYGRMVTINVHQKVPTAGYSLGAYSNVIAGVVGATAYRPDMEVTFSWRTMANQVGIGSYNTSGQVVINSASACTLNGDGTLMYTINFIKP